MGQNKGRVREVRIGASGKVELSIACPAAAIPQAGQYLMAVDLNDERELLGTPLFLVENIKHGFWASPNKHVSWSPGAVLDLAGPLGHGFDLPGNIQRLGLVAMGETVARLLPLVDQAVIAHAALTLFTDLHLPLLPAAVEVYPLSSLKDAMDWPDYLMLDVPLECISELRQILGVPDGAILPCPAQVLVITPMPCAGLAQCGACAVHSRRGWKLACEEGPVFDLRHLDW